MLLSEKVMLLTETFFSLSAIATDDRTASVFAETIKQQQPTTSENQRTVQFWWTMNLYRIIFQMAWRWSSTTSTWTRLRSITFYVLLLLVHTSTWRHKPTTVLNSEGVLELHELQQWTLYATELYVVLPCIWGARHVHSPRPCIHQSLCARHMLLLRRLPCTRRQHARHLLSCSRVISTVMHSTYVWVSSTVHPLTCTARTVIQSTNRASSVHSSVCTACTVISRRSVHNSSSFRTTSTAFYYIVHVNYIVFLCGRNYAEHPSAADVHLNSPAPELIVMNGSHCSGL